MPAVQTCIELQKITPSTTTGFFLLYMRMVYRNIRTVYPSYKCSVIMLLHKVLLR
jgi:hypothetical protein